MVCLICVRRLALSDYKAESSVSASQYDGFIDSDSDTLKIKGLLPIFDVLSLPVCSLRWNPQKESQTHEMSQNE